MRRDDLKLMWGELYARALRAGPRLEHWWGACPVCFLNASDAGRFAGVTWAYCGTCLVRWQVLDLPRQLQLDELDDEPAYRFALELAECIQFDDTPAPVPNTFHGRNSLTDPTSFGIDPQRFQATGELRLLRYIPAPQRVRLTDHVLRALPDAIETNPITGHRSANAHRVWERIRDLPVTDDGVTVSDILTRPDLPSPLTELGKLCGFLLGLHEKRQLLEQQLAMLDGIEAGFAKREKSSS